MKACPACAAQLPDTATSCKYCGHGGGVVASPVARRVAAVQTGTKVCPFCSEQIQRSAIKCKHCGSMLDGSGSKVTVSGADPFAEYHTDIKGKKAGKITVVGYLGIGLGILFIVGAFLMLAGGPRGRGDTGEGVLITGLMGLGFIVGSYLWARR